MMLIGELVTTVAEFPHYPLLRERVFSFLHYR